MERSFACGRLLLTFSFATEGKSARRQSSTPQVRRNLEGYLFIGPWLIGFLAFILGPFAFSFVLALSEWSILPPKFVGLGNFEKLLGEDLFWKSLRVTTIFTGVRSYCDRSSASLLNQGIRAHRLFQAGFYMPVMFSGVVLGVLWAWMFPFDYGLINDLLRRIGITGPRWLSTPPLALTSIIIMSMWRVGGMMVIFLAGLKDIPSELYEAAEIDGASGLSRFFAITIPMLTPIVLFNLVMSMIQSFQVFGEVALTTRHSFTCSTSIARPSPTSTWVMARRWPGCSSF